MQSQDREKPHCSMDAAENTVQSQGPIHGQHLIDEETIQISNQLTQRLQTSKREIYNEFAEEFPSSSTTKQSLTKRYTIIYCPFQAVSSSGKSIETFFIKFSKAPSSTVPSRKRCNCSTKKWP